MMAEVVIEEALRAGDVVGGSGHGAGDGFGAYGRLGIVAGKVKPISRGIHEHAVIALAPGRPTRSPVCVRAVVH